MANDHANANANANANAYANDNDSANDNAAQGDSCSATLLVELFVEELPPKALDALGQAFGAGLLASLQAQGLAGDSSVLTTYATPRRLAAQIGAVASKAGERRQQHKLMPVTVALDAEGRPTPALLKKLAALGTDASVLPKLRRRIDGKAEALFLDRSSAGASLAEGLQRALDETLRGCRSRS